MTQTPFPAHTPPVRPPRPAAPILERLERVIPRKLVESPAAGASHAGSLEMDLPAVLLQGDRVLARRMLSALVDAANAVWAATGRRGAVTFTFDGQALSAEGGPPHYSCTLSYWMASVHRALVLRRADAIRSALAFPHELLGSASNAVGDAYKGELALAMRTLLAGEPSVAGSHLDEAEALAAPAVATIGGPRRARYARAQVAMMRAIGAMDQRGFSAAAWEALDAHRALAGRGRQRSELAGTFALEGTALAARAVDRGRAWEIEWSYTPAWLVEGGAP